MRTDQYLLDGAGRQLFPYGGPNSYNIHNLAEYRVVMDWVDRQPAMIIASHLRPEFAFIICLSSIGKYATPEGKPNSEGVEELAKALPEFGKTLERAPLHRLVDIVLRYTSELIGMPPEPRSHALAEGKPLWEVTEKDRQTGKVISEATI